MEIKSYSPSEQVDIAVDLGVVPPPLPEIEFLRDFALNIPNRQTKRRSLAVRHGAAVRSVKV